MDSTTVLPRPDRGRFSGVPGAFAIPGLPGGDLRGDSAADVDAGGRAAAFGEGRRANTVRFSAGSRGGAGEGAAGGRVPLQSRGVGGGGGGPDCARRHFLSRTGGAGGQEHLRYRGGGGETRRFFRGGFSESGA